MFKLTLSLFIALASSVLFLAIASSDTLAVQADEVAELVKRAGRIDRLPTLLVAKQDNETKQDEDVKKQEDDKKAEEAKEAEDDEEALVDSADSAGPSNPVDPKLIRLHMWDGSIVSGQILVDAINVKTEFGSLSVPIHRIVQFNPGLDTLAPLNEKLSELVEQLGSRNFDEREAAHRELSAMGLQLRTVIDGFDDGGSAERKKHLDLIKKEILELADEALELGDGEIGKRALVYGDTIETPDFTIVGKIQESSFKIQTKYGLLEVNLADVDTGERRFSKQAADIRKNVVISSTSFWQTDLVSTKIRVNRGDKIFIKASGTIDWQNWGNIKSTPDGISNQGQWRGIQCGTLVAKIGNSNDPIKIGSNGEFVAKSSGLLQLCISMQDNYANNNGYRWIGDYKARVLVRPAGSQ